MKTNKGIIGIGLLVAIVLGIVVVGGGAYYLGNNNFKKELNNPVVNTEENLSNVATLPSTYGGDSIKLLSFKAVNGNFVVETDYFHENALIRVFADPTGTGIGELDPMTTGAFIGTMTPDLTGENVKWTLSGNNFKDKITNHLYAKLYFNGNASNLSINFPKEGVFGYEDIFGKNLNVNNLKTYTNKELGIEFKYPTTAKITEVKLGRTDLKSGEVIVSLPFLTHYDAWTSKVFNIVTYNDSCKDYLPTSTTPKKIINGVSYMFEDPEWTGTSGMSSISKWRKYFHESSGKCYIISERISGLGNNERPSTYTFPSDVDKFLEGELVDLDKIMASVKIF